MADNPMRLYEQTIFAEGRQESRRRGHLGRTYRRLHQAGLVPQWVGEEADIQDNWEPYADWLERAIVTVGYAYKNMSQRLLTQAYLGASTSSTR